MTNRTAQESTAIGRLCFVLATGLLVAWTVERVKPAIWFGIIFGIVVGSCALAIRAWWPATFIRGRWLVPLLAILGTAGSLALAQERLWRYRIKTPQSAAAEAIINSLERQGTDLSKENPSTDGSIRRGFSRTDQYRQGLVARYRRVPGLRPEWALGLELILSGICSLMVLKAGERRTLPVTSPKDEAV